MQNVPNLGFTIKLSSIHGQGLFATRQFNQGETVVQWTNSRELNRVELTNLPEAERPYVEFQDEKAILMGIPERFVNHSCNPNTRPGTRCDIASRRIDIGEEITCDYSNFTIPGGKFTCSCGTSPCKGVITGKVS